MVGWGMLGLFVIAIGIFLLPFAFPTPPRIVTRFQSTRLFSPNDDGRREVARVSIRIREAGVLRLDVTADGEVIDTLLDDEQVGRGWHRASWNGRTADGTPVADGVYGLRLHHQAGKKNYRASRRIVVDTTPPRITTLSALSAGGAALEAPAQCRVVAAGDGASRIRVWRTARVDGGATVEPPILNRPMRDGVPVIFRWGGPATPVKPGLMGIEIRLEDAARNRVTEHRTCWIGNLRGNAVPARPRPLDIVRVRLRNVDGTPLPPRTPVHLQLYRRIGTPGTATRVLGARVARPIRTTAADAQIRVPPSIAPRTLWLSATTADGRALIGLGG